MINFTFLFLWTLVIFSTLIAAELPLSYPVEWSSVPQTPPERRNLESPYLGKCICDVTWGSCDPNCCCDIDCSETVRSKFKFCLQESVGYPPVEYCDGGADSKKNMLPNHHYVDKTPTGSAGVCIVRTNNVAGLTPFFALPSSVSKPTDTHLNDKVKSNGFNGYVVNGGLLLMKNIEVASSVYEFRNLGLLTIPSASQNGYCKLKGRRVRFMNPIDSTACVLKGGDICKLFPTTSFTNLYLTNFGNYSTTAFTPIEVQIFNYTSGELLITLDSNSIIPEEYQSIISGENCKNAVVQIRNILVYSSNESGLLLTNATTSLYIRDINIEYITSLLFQTEFTQKGILPPTNYFPATPGYFDGSLIRAGTLVTQEGKKAIAERVIGFSIPSGDRSCYQNNYQTVRFLHDVRSSSCTISSTEDELRKLCSGIGTGTLLRSILSINAGSSPTFDVETKPIDYVARTNDALVNDTTAWIKIEGLDFGDISPDIYNSVERECSNIYIGIHYTFVLSRIGAENNPQDVIVAAFADPIVGKWKIRNNQDFSGNATSIQRFRFVVSFTRLDPRSEKKIHQQVIAPPILPRLDDNVFYPFKPPK
ncbi:Tectonic-1 [Trypanosoma theileri]|uniref:Tectonic-1 n=1 Tax=Trypanosoma theileri TaxID=67003 RepID=A0A1X0P3E6_9TRYP|nr:Tectonic-1 [Trypanosoma theileri]ORC91437.1 Tectonic-1 [Trypanosoma theileri]